MKKKTKYMLVGVMTTALVGVGVFKLAHDELKGNTDFTTLDEEILYDADVCEYKGIRIVGPPVFICNVWDALDYLCKIEEQGCNEVKTHLTAIKYHKPGFVTRTSGINVRTGIVNSGSDMITSSNAWNASGLVHEACHVIQYKEGRINLTGEVREQECLNRQNEALYHTHLLPIKVEEKIKSQFWEKEVRTY